MPPNSPQRPAAPLAFEAFAAGMPSVRDRGWRLLSASAGELELSAPIREDMLQIEGRVHGGWLATLADSAAVYALLRELWPQRTVTSVEFKLNFVRPALLERGELSARARVVHRGRRTALCEAELAQAGELVAKGLFTYLVLEREA